MAKLSPMDFLKMGEKREAQISRASADPVPSLLSYRSNALNAELHPNVQHLQISEVKDLPGRVRSYILTPDKEAGTEHLAYFAAGQYLSIHIRTEDADFTRPYSIASAPEDALNDRYMLTIRRTEGGLSSAWIYDNWMVGTKVEASQPLGNFTYEPLRDAGTIVALIGGTSITPARSLAYAIAGGEEEADKLILLYGVKKPEDALYLDDFKKLAADSGKFEFHMVYSDVKVDGEEYGFIDAAIIEKYAPKDHPYSLFIAGPQAMQNFLDGEVAKLGIRHKYIRRELFGEVHNPSTYSDYKAPEQKTVQITVKCLQDTRVITARTDDSILSSLEHAKIAAPSHCRTGECGWCRSRLISGNVYIPEKTDGRREADKIYGYIHPCSTYPLSDLVIEINPFAN